jgi:hypothetical protein
MRGERQLTRNLATRGAITLAIFVGYKEGIFTGIFQTFASGHIVTAVQARSFEHYIISTQSSMKYTSLLAFVALLLTSNASPLVASRAASGVIGEQCTNVRIDAGWLIGDCLTGSGDTRITSGTFIAGKISNEDGILTWKNE